MEIYKNDVFYINAEERSSVPTGLYRVLDILPKSSLILFPLDLPNKVHRPIAVSISSFEAEFKEGRAYKGKYDLPSYIRLAESEIKEKYKDLRDKNFKLIKKLVESRIFLFDYATKRRINDLSHQARLVGKDRNYIAKLLNSYWRYGQDKNALLPKYSNCGVVGSERNINKKPIGAPPQNRTLAIKNTDIYILTSIDKKQMKSALSKYHLKPDGLNLRKTYEQLLKEYYAEEIRRADALGIEPKVPSYRQLYYWKKKFFTKELIISTTTKRDFELNRRALLGSSKHKWASPGNCYEIDATVADVHIVSELNTDKILGRPTIYSVVDRGSAMIVGLHVSLYYASWQAARQALASALLPKSDYCKEYNVDIIDSDWPAFHVPQRLMCDNGEMIGLKPQESLVPMMEMQFSPPYRPDFKAYVERRFGLLNSEVIHELLGSTKGGKVVRGSKDPRKDAAFTLKEFTQLLIDAALNLNNTQYESLGRASSLLIENDLEPTPLNYWKIHVENFQHSLKISDVSDVIGRIYPSANAYLTRDGVEYNGLYYSNELIKSGEFAAFARTQGRTKLDARINENTTNYIYVKLPGQDEFEKCTLLDKSKLLKNCPMVEAEYVIDWIKASKSKKPINVQSIESGKKKSELTASVKSRAKQSSTSFAKKTRQVKQNRKNEISNTANQLTKSKEVESQSKHFSQSNDVYYLPRRRKD